MDEGALTGLLGLALRAGQLKLGTGRCVDAVRRGENLLILVDASASENTAKRLKDASTFHQQEFRVMPAGLLEAALGRSGIMAVGLAEGGLRDRISRLAVPEIYG